MDSFRTRLRRSDRLIGFMVHTAAVWRVLAFVVVLMVSRGTAAQEPAPEKPIDIGSRRELFVDRFLIDQMKGTRLKLHEPRLAPPVSPPRPHGHYGTVLFNGEKFQFYYRGDKDPKITWKTHGIEAAHDGEVTLYAESPDGIHWTLPNLKLFEHPSFPAGNIVLMNEFMVNHNFAPFIDTRPGVPADEKYKALGGLAYQPQKAQQDVRAKRGPGGLKAFTSPDGIHWKKVRDEAVVPEAWGRYFDSQNVAFWSEAEQCYVCYFRIFDPVRSIARTTSPDFLSWTPPTPMKPNAPNEELYTSCTQPYVRAPHISISLPTRFVAKRGAATDIAFMTTRGGSRYDRTFMESFIRPGLSKSGWANRANYVATGIYPTSDTEMSLFLTEGRRYTLRLDGFASVNAPFGGGSMITKPLTFNGQRLEINVSTSAGGQVRVAVLDAAGKAPLPGFSLDDCEPIYGDEIARTVTWKAGSDVGALAGRPIRLEFVMEDADLFAIRFCEAARPVAEVGPAAAKVDRPAAAAAMLSHEIVRATDDSRRKGEA